MLVLRRPNESQRSSKGSLLEIKIEPKIKLISEAPKVSWEFRFASKELCQQEMKSSKELKAR